MDSWIFSATDNSVRTVIAMGREVVTEGQHAGEAAATEQFLNTLKRLADRSFVMTTLKLELARIRLADIRQILAEPVVIELPDQAWRAVGRSRANVEDALSG